MLGVERLERGVLGLKADATVAFAMEGLDRRLVRGLVVADESDDDLTCPGVVLFADRNPNSRGSGRPTQSSLGLLQARAGRMRSW